MTNGEQISRDSTPMAAETSPTDRAAAGRVGASGEATSEVRQELSRLMDQLARSGGHRGVGFGWDGCGCHLIPI